VLATFIDLMVILGAFIASLAGLNLAVRMAYAMGRDRALPSFFGWTHPRYKSPWVGIVVGLLLALVLGGTLGVAMGPLTYGGFLAAAGSLGILLAYILVAISGIIFFLRFPRPKRGGMALVFDVLFPAIAVLLCGATVYSSLVPIPPAPLNYAPFVAGAWLVLGIILLGILQLRSPGQVSQFGMMLGEGSSDSSEVPG
jgi:amino acid transporter